MEFAMSFLFYIVVLIFSIVLHEVSHGAVAYMLGDPTAKYAGRLTLNPLPHIDLFGSIILPLMLMMPGIFGGPTIVFGWAKPVPYNPYNLRSKKWGSALVGIAGPCANIFLAVFMSIIIRVLPFIGGLSSAFIANFSAPLAVVVLLNIGLAVFNLVPVPPLDGSKLLFALLPYQWSGTRQFLERNGIFLLLIFIFFFSGVLSPIVFFLFHVLSGGSL